MGGLNDMHLLSRSSIDPEGTAEFSTPESHWAEIMVIGAGSSAARSSSRIAGFADFVPSDRRPSLCIPAGHQQGLSRLLSAPLGPCLVVSSEFLTFRNSSVRKGLVPFKGTP